MGQDKIKVLGAGILSVIIMTAVVGISSIPQDAEASHGDDVTLRLKWLHQAQFAGPYTAEQKGFYHDNGIDITINPGGIDFPAVQMVAGGGDMFGVTGGDQILLAREKGVPIVAIAVIYRGNPFVMFALESSGISEPKDFVGKTIGVQPGANEELMYRAMMKNAGIDTALLSEESVRFDITPLLTGQIDVWPGYAINQPITAEEKGFPVNLIWPSDYGVELYADTLFTTEDLIKNNPDLVKRFVSATMQGWNYAYNNVDEVVGYTLMYSDVLTREHETSMMKASLQSLKPTDRPIGPMDRERWEGMQDLLLDNGFMDNAIDLDKAFTNEFLPTAGAAEASPADDVTLRLKWLHQAQFAGFYTADQKGFYENNEIDITINPGGIDFPAVQMVAGGGDMFGVTGGDQILLARDKGVPIVAIAVIYRESPFVLFALEESGITEPKDFIGKNVGVKLGGNEELTYRAMMKGAGVDTSLVNEKPVKFDITPLLTGQIDVWPGYAINEPVTAEEKGFSVNIIWPSDYGVNLYADTIFTTEDMINNNPNLVKRFVSATMRGWDYAYNNVDEVVGYTLMYSDVLTREHETSMMKASLKSLKPTDKPIGPMDRKVLEGMQKILLDNEFMDNPIDLDKSFTNEFLPTAQAAEVTRVEEPEAEAGGCLIATAAFGSEMAPQVQFLREIRDNTVLQTESGFAFMTGFNQFYYSFSPAIADYERENPAFKEAVKLTITPLLTSLTLLQYADIDSESEMLGYGIGVILLNIGMYFVAPAVLVMAVRKKITKK